MNKPNCYDCIHRRSLPGDCHSTCGHPKAHSGINDPVLKAMSLFVSLNLPIKNDLNVLGKKYGIDSGWFNWPWNYDPIWLEQCDGFEPIK